MKSLFVRIFVWFWMAMGVIVIASLLTSVFLGTPLVENWVSRGMDIYALNAVHLYQSEGTVSLRNYLSQTPEIDVAIVDPSEKWIVGSPGPWQRVLLGRAAQSHHTECRVRLRWQCATWVQTPEGNFGVVAHVEHPGRTRGLPFAPMLLRITILVLCAGLLCLSLARYITRPVQLLQGAVRKVAAGDLSTRVSPQLLDRKDELAFLARDFDHMAERIEGLLRTQRQMLGDISHELRTPLTRLSVAVELAEQGDTAALQRMSIEIGRINDLIEQILTVTRLDAGDRKPQLESVDLDNLLAQIVEDGNYAGQQRKIRVELTEHSGVRVMADPSLLRTAVENIVHNALQYTKPESTIEVASRKNDDNVLIIVRDHGSGVPASALPRIFEPFYRVSESRSEKAGGRGLGLAISQRIVSLHGGAITARNASDGGLQVEIVWPGNPQA